MVDLECVQLSGALINSLSLKTWIQGGVNQGSYVSMQALGSLRFSSNYLGITN
jgi:hypothetical protein